MTQEYIEKASGVKTRIAIANLADGTAKHIRTSFIPRLGEQIDMGYHPAPTVKSVVWYPTANSINMLKIDSGVQCLVFVE